MVIGGGKEFSMRWKVLRSNRLGLVLFEGRDVISVPIKGGDGDLLRELASGRDWGTGLLLV